MKKKLIKSIKMFDKFYYTFKSCFNININFIFNSNSNHNSNYILNFKNVLVLLVFVLFFSVSIFSEPLFVTNFTSDFSLVYENFSQGVPVYKFFKVQINSTIQTKRGYLELLSNNVIIKMAPNTMIFTDVNNDILTVKSGEVYLTVNALYNVKMFDKSAIFYKGSYFIKTTKDSFLVYSNNGKIDYKGETFVYGKDTALIIFLKDKYSIKKNSYYNRNLAEFTNELILKDLIVYEKYLDYFMDILLFLLDENNSYINDIENLRLEFEQFTKLKNNFINRISSQNKNEKDILLEEYFKLNNFLDLKLLNYNNIINNFLSFYFLAKNYIHYFDIIKNQLEFIKKREKIDPLWNSELRANFYLVWNKFKNFEENIYLFKSAIGGNLENIFNNDSKLLYYLNFYNEQKNNISQKYLKYIDSLDIKENKEVYKNLIRIFIKFSSINIIVNSNINRVFINNQYLDSFRKLLENNFIPDISIDEMFYRINIGYSLTKEKKEIIDDEKQIDNYYKMFNYLLINKNIALLNINEIVVKIKKLYSAIKLNLLTYYKTIDKYEYNINKYQRFLASKINKNIIAVYQYEFNNSFNMYFNYIEEINNKLLSVSEKNILLKNKYYEIQNFLYKLIELKYNFYKKYIKNFVFLKKDIFERKYNQNIKNLENIKKIAFLNDVDSRNQNYIEKLSISLIATQEIKSIINNFLNYYHNLYSISDLKILCYSLLSSSSNNDVKQLIVKMDELDSTFNYLVKYIILYNKNIDKLNEIYSLIYLDYKTYNKINIDKQNNNIIGMQKNIKDYFKNIIEITYRINLTLLSINDIVNNLDTSTSGLLKLSANMNVFEKNLSIQMKKLEAIFSINDLILIKY